jgi:serine-type D-Ala-D-Ala carboxypeptidase/endopeptidase (penicillin-binding protein 4)
VALWVSPPLSEYVKLVLKVSHNLGANLAPLLLAAKEGKKTFDEGMLLLGNFITKKVKLSPDSFVFIDGAGGNENRLTPQDEVALLNYMYKKSPSQFRNYFDALPILGVDGSLADFAKNTKSVGKVRAKTGTSASFNLSTNQFFLITQALGGYIEGKNGHLLAYMVVVNNGSLPTINDIFPIFEDVSLISNSLYENSQK